MYRKLQKEPLFCEGAAKAHFGWHMLSGGNAFDAFPTEVFKEKIAEYPMDEAPHMANDFTRLNFGWWAFREDIQPDHFEYGISRAAAWDCPVTVMENIQQFASNPRSKDVFEVLRCWEDVRIKNLLTKDQKEKLKNPNQEHILLINERGEYELVPYEKIEGTDENISAFYFERNGKNCVVLWHKTGKGIFELPLLAEQIVYADEIGGDSIVPEGETFCKLPIEGRRYLITETEKTKLLDAVRNMKPIE